jgi:hypothetical protein
MRAFHPIGGAARDRHERGMECGGRGRLARRARRTRTAKLCGPDIPTLMSSFAAIRKATVANKPGHRGEHRAAVNTIAQGMSMFRLTWSDYACVLTFIAHKAAGAAKHPAFPAPSVFRATVQSQNSDADRAAGMTSCVIGDRVGWAKRPRPPKLQHAKAEACPPIWMRWARRWRAFATPYELSSFRARA